MGAKVLVLPESVASRIAAGEVVERPASVLKELLENALDAGARRIEIEADQAGKKRLRVRDDGSGMSAEDCRLALRRHATSKIKDLSDLERLETYGFRGEALYAVSAVSRLALTSGERTGPGVRAWTVEAEGGALSAEHEAPPVAGTTVEVRDLFFNTPARLKFLKSDATEKAQLTRVVEELALARTELSFVYALDGRESLRLPPLGSLSAEALRSRIQELFGFEFLNSMVEVASTRSDLKLLAFVSKADRLASGRHGQYFFVNRRAVQNKTLQQALYRAYESRHGRHPACVAFLDLPPSEVDVNVHPQKREVRFVREAQVFEFLDSAFGRALGGTRLPPPLVRPASGGPSASELRDAIRTYRTQPYAPRPTEPSGEEVPPQAVVGKRPTEPSGEEVPPQASVGERPTEPSGAPAPAWYHPPFRFLGQLEQSYLVFESRGGLLLVDQHAAAERVVFERYLREFVHGAPKVQRLMLPVTVELAPSVAQKVLGLKDWLHRAGFEVDDLGRGTLAVHAVPAVFDLQAAEIKDLFGRISGELDTRRSSEEARRDTIATWACKKAVKAHDRLSAEEALHLLEDLKDCENGLQCPHGRPSMLRLTRDELARRFGRPGAPPLL